MAKRLYWPSFEKIIDKATKYYLRYGFKFPADLRALIDATALALEAMDLALKLWDFGHAGGEPSTF